MTSIRFIDLTLTEGGSDEGRIAAEHESSDFENELSKLLFLFPARIQAQQAEISTMDLQKPRCKLPPPARYARGHRAPHSRIMNEANEPVMTRRFES